MTERAPRGSQDGYQALAAAVVLRAAKEMRGEGGRASKEGHLRYDKAWLRIEATVWLASRGATRWFDCCGLEQKYALGKMRWSSHAQELLEEGSAHLSPAKIQVLERGLDALRPSK